MSSKNAKKSEQRKSNQQQIEQAQAQPEQQKSADSSHSATSLPESDSISIRLCQLFKEKQRHRIVDCLRDQFILDDRSSDWFIQHEWFDERLFERSKLLFDSSCENSHADYSGAVGDIVYNFVDSLPAE